jgi:hypothetical protein
MAGAPAALGHDRSRDLHDRLPVRAGRLGDQDLARLEVGKLMRIVDDRTGPAAIFSPTARPVASTGPEWPITELSCNDGSIG